MSYSPLTFFSFSWLFISVLLICMSIPLIAERVKPNSFYGIRNSNSYSSEEAWYKINKKGGKIFLAAGVAISLISVLALLFFSHSSFAGLVFFNTLPVVVLAVAAVVSWR